METFKYTLSLLGLVTILNFIKWIYRSFIVMKYVPIQPVKNLASKDIDDFGTMWALNDKNDIYLDKSGNIAIISGQESFIQLLKGFMYITLDENKIQHIGCEVGQSLFYTNNKEFQRQCPYFIDAIIKDTSMNKCIEEIYSIKKRKKFFIFGEPYIFIDIKVKGRPHALTIELKNLDFLAQIAKKQS